MKNCNSCIYKGIMTPEITYDRNGYVVETRYIGIRCTNKDCIFYRSPADPIVRAGLDNCKGYKPDNFKCCATCKHFDKMITDEPCFICNELYDKWEAADNG